MSLYVGPSNDFAWLKERTGCVLTEDMSAIAATDETGRIRGMVGYCNVTHSAVQMHIAVDSPMVWRRLLWPGLEYPFIQGGKRVLLGVIRAGNKQSIRFAEAVGFKKVFHVKDGHAIGEDLVFLELRKEDCRYLAKRETKEQLRRVG